jgi:cytochrome bd ubiquinol oxidase subunit I
MDITALLLSRIQFAFTISFHIIFPAFSIGLAAWLTVLEALHLKTGRPAYRLLFEFWLKIFGVAFGLGVVSGVVMAFQFGTNWSVLSKMSGPIQGAASVIRDVYGLRLGSELFWSPHFRSAARTPVVLSVLDRDGRGGNNALGVLDHGQ